MSDGKTGRGDYQHRWTYEDGIIEHLQSSSANLFFYTYLLPPIYANQFLDHNVLAFLT